MAFKEAPKVDTKELFYSEQRFIIEFVGQSIYGQFLGNTGRRANSFADVKLFLTYEEAEQAIKDSMLEWVSIKKVYL